jgi:malate dehydrogenase (oxaloacetate-decarboxylating)
MQRFAGAFKKVFPNALCQWEDFSRQNAFDIRDAYFHDLISFNDDIQGTGAVATAMKIKEEKLRDQIFLIYGAGAGGIGIAEQIERALIESGLPDTEAQDRIFTLDRIGLVTSDIAEPYQSKFAKDSAELPWYRGQKDGNLLNVIKSARVTVLIGTSGQSGHFTKEVIAAMVANTERPVIMPLSNPTENSEASPADILHWTSGKALVAAGSPFEPVTQGGKKIRIGQCNNVFIFPGLGLGVLASGGREVLPAFFTAAAKAVSECVASEDFNKGILMPPVESLREAGRKVAFAVGCTAIRENVSGHCAFSEFQHRNDEERLKTLIERMMWKPEYVPLIPK